MTAPPSPAPPSPARLVHPAIAGVDRAARIATLALRDAFAASAPGITTHELAAVVGRAIRAAGARPVFESVTRATDRGPEPFGHAACISVNEVATHGLPGPRVLCSGDVLTVDVGVELDGWHADVATSWCLDGPGDGAASVAVGRAAIAAGLRVLRSPQSRDVWWSRVAGAVRDVVARAGGWTIPPGFSGHGIGRSLHEPPTLRLARDIEPSGPGDVPLVSGMIFTIEPLLVRVGTGLTDDADGWSVRTLDGSWAVHEERVVGLTEAGGVMLGWEDVEIVPMVR